MYHRYTLNNGVACLLRRRKSVRVGLTNSTAYNFIVDWLENYVKDMYQSSSHLKGASPAGLHSVPLFFLPRQVAIANLGNSYLLYQ